MGSDLEEDCNRIIIFAVEVMQDAELVQYKRLRLANFLCLPDILEREVQMIGAKIFHADPKPWDM